MTTPEGIPRLTPSPEAEVSAAKKDPCVSSIVFPEEEACLGPQAANVWNLAAGGGPERSDSYLVSGWSWLSTAKVTITLHLSPALSLPPRAPTATVTAAPALTVSAPWEWVRGAAGSQWEG